MATSFSNKKLDIPCKNCGKNNAKTFGWLKSNSSFQCSCGTTIHVDASNFNREMRKVEKSLDDLTKSLRKLGK